MAPRWDQATLFAGIEPTSTPGVLSSAIIDTEGYPAGWVELLIPNAGGVNNFAGTIDLMGGNYRDATKLTQIALDTAQIYVDKAKYSAAAIPGLTHGGDTNPSRLTVAATLADSTRVKIPTINWPRFLQLVITRTSGGSAAEYWEACWFGRSSS